VKPVIHGPSNAPLLHGDVKFSVLLRQLGTLRSLRSSEAARVQRTGSRAVFIAATLGSGALGARQALLTPSVHLTSGKAESAPLETVWLITVLLAAWFGVRTIDLVFRTDNAHALRHFPVSGWVSGLDRIWRQWSEVARLLVIPLVWMGVHLAIRPGSSAALALAMIVCSLPVISAGSIASVVLPGYMAAMSGRKRRSAATAQQMTAALYRVVPGVGVGITAALLLLLKLGFEEPLRMGGYTGHLVWARSFQVGVGLPLCISVAVLGLALRLWSQHHSWMASAFDDADGMVDIRERVSDTGHVWPHDRGATAIAIRQLVLSRQQPWAFGTAVGVAILSALASFGSTLDSYHLAFALIPAAVTGVWLHPGAALKTLRPAFAYLAPGFVDDRRSESMVVLREYGRRMMPAVACAWLAAPAGWRVLAPCLAMCLFVPVHQLWVRRSAAAGSPSPSGASA